LNANLLADQPLENAYLFATVLNNDVFKINFQTHDHLAKKLKEDYTQITQKQMEKIVEIRKVFFEKKDVKYAESVLIIF
jgi:thiamine pyrophosphokinase